MKNTNRGFKLASPLKQTGPGDSKKASETTTSSKSYPAQSGGYKVTATETKVKKSATGATVGVGGNEAKLKKGAKNLGANYRPSKAETAAANKRLKAAREKDKAAGESTKATAASEETTTKVSPELTEAKAGTTSDTFTPEERRMQNRGEKIVMRQERQMGKQALRREKQAIKGSAEYKSMTGAERRAAKYELKHGQTNEQKASGKSTLDRFGPEAKSNAEQARKMKQGQGEQSLSYIKQQKERPGEATTTRNAQYLQGKNTEFSSSTKNYEDVQKAEEGGKKIKAEASDKLPEVTPGTKSTSSSESSSTTNKPKEEPKKYDATKSAPFLAAGNQGPENAPSKMKASALKFVMKGFGSKAGFNFNKKK